jgi:hypothetical protein
MILIQVAKNLEKKSLDSLKKLKKSIEKKKILET